MSKHQQGERIRFGIIGAGGRGGRFTPVLLGNPATEVVAFCDTNQEEMQKRASESGIDGLFTDAEAMFDSGLIDAVVVGTPMKFHAPQAIAALERNIHVLSEVPAAYPSRNAVT